MKEIGSGITFIFLVTVVILIAFGVLGNQFIQNQETLKNLEMELEAAYQRIIELETQIQLALDEKDRSLKQIKELDEQKKQLEAELAVIQQNLLESDAQKQQLEEQLSQISKLLETKEAELNGQLQHQEDAEAMITILKSQIEQQQEEIKTLRNTPNNNPIEKIVGDPELVSIIYYALIGIVSLGYSGNLIKQRWITPQHNNQPVQIDPWDNPQFRRTQREKARRMERYLRR